MASSTGLFMVLVAMFWSKAMAQSGCTSVIFSLAPCLNYVTGSSSTPSSSCCSQLAGVVKTQPRCLCEVINGSASSVIGVSLNRTLALALPGACKVQTPPVSECYAANKPAMPPYLSPVGSPQGSPGSRPFPARSESTSNRLDINMALQLIPFVLLMMSRASAYMTF